VLGAAIASLRRSSYAIGDVSIRWGVLLPTFGIGDGVPPVVEAARRAEQLGFDALWAGDHLICDAPVLDALCALSAAAAVTNRIELGASVLQLGLRQPAWAAKQLATVATLAPGRLRLGVGVGGEYPQEFTAAGVDRRTRGARLDEIMRVLPLLLRGEPVDHCGPLAPVRVTGLKPATPTHVPVSVGGRSDAALRRAARYGDQWMPIWLSPQTVRDRARRLAVLAAENGRPVPSIALLILVNVDEDIATARSAAAELVHRQYQMALERVDRWTAYGPAETVADLLQDYADVGVSEFVLMPASADPLAQYEGLAGVRELVRPPRPPSRETLYRREWPGHR